MLGQAVGRQNLARVQISVAWGVIELLWLLFATLRAIARPRQDLVLENLLLRHQLAILTRPTRTRPRARLRTWDKLLWVLARRLWVGWREHLAFVTPDTVVRWHRQAGVCSGLEVPLPRWPAHLSAEMRELINSMSRDNHL